MLTRLDSFEEEHTGGKEIEKTNSMIEKDKYSHRNMRTPLRKDMESTLDFEATRIPQLKNNTKDWLAE